MSKIRLIPIDRELLSSLESAERFRKLHAANVDGCLELARSVVEQTLQFGEKICAPPPWTGYLGATEQPDEIVGCCGFKGNPLDDASVEIAYFTFPKHERRGIGSQMAGALVAIARRERNVRFVRAHTLPEQNASTRILEKNGFARLGTAVDPEEGHVWIWCLGLTDRETARGDRLR